MSLKNKTIPDHPYKVTFGVNQTEKIEEECNKQNKTPTDFIKDTVNDITKKINESVE